jgi:hypothetical protein
MSAIGYILLQVISYIPTKQDDDTAEMGEAVAGEGMMLSSGSRPHYSACLVARCVVELGAE